MAYLEIGVFLELSGVEDLEMHFAVEKKAFYFILFIYYSL